MVLARFGEVVKLISAVAWPRKAAVGVQHGHAAAAANLVAEPRRYGPKMFGLRAM